MKAEEIESKIYFVERPLDKFTMVIEAEVAVSVIRHIDNAALESCHDPIGWKDSIKAGMREEIMRTIYQDQTQELYKAVMEFLAVEPFNFSARREAEGKLFRAAMRQKPL